MANKALDTVLQHLRRSMLRQNGSRPSDGELLDRYVARRDEVAFEALVRRHGTMVLGVCRRSLRKEAEAGVQFKPRSLVWWRKPPAAGRKGLVANGLSAAAPTRAGRQKAMTPSRWEVEGRS